ncbi:MAG: GntP family permease [Planctomycetota bacterium]|nr:MAG: GntP family permease [Planctomycetota bacterium]
MWLITILVISILFIVISTSKYHFHPFLALLFVAVGFGLLSGMPLPDVVNSINDGFGGTLSSIGIVIIAGVIIGTFLEHSGGAFAMAARILKIIGEKHVPLAMSIIGYFVSIPVFADSGFVILIPLNRALSKEAKLSLAGSAIALSTGLIATHCLVPPTPGPIAAAGILEADLGLVILLGMVVSVFALSAGWLFATKVASKTYIDPNPELSEEQVLEKIKHAPSAFKAFIPILVPIVLIVMKSISDFPTDQMDEGWLKAVLSFLTREGPVKSCVGFIGAPVIALLIGVLLAFSLPKKLDRQMLSTTGWVGQALLNAAIIIMITGAGGSFGMILRNSPIASVIGESLSKANLGIWLPFIVSAAIKTAQGSSTVALITTASLMAPLMEPLGFEGGVTKALVVLSIGAGSMVVSHANDSFFWVFTQMTRMDVKTGYRLHTFSTLVIGVTSAIVIWVISLFVL